MKTKWYLLRGSNSSQIFHRKLHGTLRIACLLQIGPGKAMLISKTCRYLDYNQSFINCTLQLQWPNLNKLLVHERFSILKSYYEDFFEFQINYSLCLCNATLQLSLKIVLVMYYFSLSICFE